MSIHESPKKAQKRENPPLKSLPARRPNGPECSHSLENIEVKRPQLVEVPENKEVSVGWKLAWKDGAFKRLSKIQKHRARSREVVSEIEENHQNTVVAEKAETLSECGNYLRFRHWRKVSKTRLVTANFCKCFILCTFCASLRASKYCEKFVVVILEVLKTMPDLRVVHMVLSCENVESAEEAIERLSDARKRVLKHLRQSNKGSRHKSALRGVEGGIWVMEVKKGRGSKKWHPHYHVLLLTRRKINQNDMWDEWRKATKCPKVALPWLAEHGRGEQEILKVCLELFKYMIKPGSCTPAELIEVHNAVFKKYRLIQSFGCLRGVQIDEDDIGEKGREEWGPYMDFFLSWAGGEKHYVLDRVQYSEDVEADEAQGFEVDEEMKSWWDDGEPEEAPF